MKKWIPILLVFLISACSSGGKKPADKMYYRFPETTVQPIDNLNVNIKRPTAMGILGNRPMVVQTDKGGLIQMGSNFWLDSPKILLENYLSEVFIDASQGDILILNSQILALEKKQDQALLSIKFLLINNDSDIIFDKTYKNQKKLKDNTIPAFSKAIGDLLIDMTKQLSQDLQ
ncbi:MAG: hypothetical protein AB8B80_01585 [Marinicellaceae bacterium]